MATGDRIPTCWVGDDITPACSANWQTLRISHLMHVKMVQIVGIVVPLLCFE
jgi:hypothetical protein